MIDYKSHATSQILTSCIGLLNSEQQSKLSNILNIVLYDYDLVPKEEIKELPATVDNFNEEMIKRFLVAKAIESLSENSLKLYNYRIRSFLFDINKKATDITSDDIRYYLAITKSRTNNSNTTMENIRLILGSFFTWMTTEEYISKNPILKVGKIKEDTRKEEPFSSSDIELLCMACDNPRDRALIEFLLSTGCRVSEAASVDRNQIDFYNKQLEVIGKGNKQRTVYLSEKALLYIKIYLDTRTDNDPALFVSNRNPYNRLGKDSIECAVRKIGDKAGVSNTHPHRFRRTMCCNLVDRGMQIQDVKEIMGHSNLDTTMIYYNSSSKNIKNEFNKHI